MDNVLKKMCKGKTHIRLTVGTLINGEKKIKVFGENGELPNENYTYEIGSITKTFTTSLLAKSISEGKMSLDDPLSKYIDGLGEGYYPTLARLATHTSGYGYLPATAWEGIKMLILPPLSGSRNGGILPDCLQIDETRMKALVLSNKKEDKAYKWAYSNFGMGLLGYVLGKAWGKGYHETMNDFLMQDLEMPNSYTSSKSGKLLSGFNKKNQDVGNWNMEKTMMASAGDIRSTAEDMLTYAHKHMNDILPYLAMTHKKRTTVSKGGAGCGLGWVLFGEADEIIAHNGGTGAFDSLLMIDKNKKTAYVVLSNYLIGGSTLFTTVLDEIKSIK